MKPMCSKKLYQRIHAKVEKRPFKENGTEDMNFNYIHQTDVFDLVELAFIEGLASKQKAEICDCDEGIAWRQEARQKPLSNIVFCAACGRKL